MKDETDTYAKRKRSLNGLTQYYQNMLTRSLLNALDNFKTEDWTMSINDATPSEWDRLRKEHPALEAPKRTIDESMMKVYLDLADEQFDKTQRETEWWKQHVARAEQLEYEARWVDELLEKISARQDEEEEDVVNGIDEAMAKSHYWADSKKEDVVNNPDHYNTGNVECIEAIEESMTPEAFSGYLKGNCMKYLWRYSYKGKPVEDLQKAQWYLAKLLQEELFEAEE